MNKIVIHIRNQNDINNFLKIRLSKSGMRIPKNTEIIRECLSLYADNIQLIEYIKKHNSIELPKIIDIGLKFFLKQKGK